MRRLGSLVLIVLAMGLFHRLSAAAPLAGRAGLALGFLVVSGLVLGAWAESFQVPAVTAYVAVGFVLGPSWLGLVRRDEVAALAFTGDIALATVSLMAGTALRVGALSLQRRSLLRFLAATSLAPAGLVAVIMVALAHWFPPTAHEPFGNLLLVALLIGASAVASSPTLTVATASDGAVVQGVLGVSVARDLVAAVLFAVLLIGAPLISSPGAFDPHGATRLVLLLLGSVVGGLAVALGAARLARLGRLPPYLPPLLAAGVVALLARLLHVDPVLTGLFAGLWLIPWSGQSSLAAGLVGMFDSIRAPLFAAAFGLLGAGLDLVATGELWTWVLVVVIARGVGLLLGGRWAERHDVEPDLARHGWLGLISQSGLILWLAAETRRAFPEWGVSLQALIVGVVAVNAILGPLGLKWATRLAGDSLQRSG